MIESTFIFFAPISIVTLARLKLETKNLRLSLDATGSLTTLFDKTNSQEYLPAGQPAPLLQIRVGGRFLMPDKMQGNASPLQLHFAGKDITAKIRVAYKQDYLTF